jgi:hypothetical protein
MPKALGLILSTVKTRQKISQVWWFMSIILAGKAEAGRL